MHAFTNAYAFSASVPISKSLIAIFVPLTSIFIGNLNNFSISKPFTIIDVFSFIFCVLTFSAVKPFPTE